ncbi:MAG: haloacid dehalogenase-like hydrolase [Chlorobi bacterium]|nr:haloacid dehalogenase-like hydrolase [Chlorobiota bacterium]
MYKTLLLLLIALLSLNACKDQKKEKATETGDSTTIVEETGGTIKTGDIDFLPSWNNTKSKETIINFVKTVTTVGSKSYVAPENRIATFDNDGTLWSEKPTYFQVEFVLYRIKQLAPRHPEWKKDKLIQAALNHDLETMRKKYGAKGLVKLMAIAEEGITTDEFEKIVKKWITTAKHPITGKLYTEMVYQPMLELIRYLQDKDFKVYIVSGGGIDFMRVWAESVYGIPREHILGSIGKLEYEKVKGKPVLIKSSEILFVNDGAGKPMSIHQFIGKKPILSFGNSDGDIQMLEWCDANKNNNLPAFIHHTDAKREWAYDRNSRIGTLNKGLDEAAKKDWLVVDMKKDWKVIHPYELTGIVDTK